MISYTNGVTVKNAKLFVTEKFYHVVHYDTEILRIDKETKEVLIMLPVSDSSRNAIIQAFYSLGFTMEDYHNAIEKLNINQKELRKSWKNRLYQTGETKRTIPELKGVIQ